jgi:hypothetical protein
MMMVMSRPTATVRAVSADGTFTLARVPPGNVTLQIEAPGFARAEKRLEVAAGEDQDAGTLALVRAATVRGSVRDETGAPVALASVKVHEGGMQDHPMLGALRGAAVERTGRDGTFELTGLPPGKVTLVATARDFASGRSPRLELAPGQTVADVEIRLGHGGTVQGRLLVAEGRSAASFEIVVSSQTSASSGTATPRADGTFTVANLDAGRYQVQALDVGTFETFGVDVSRQVRPGRKLDLGAMLDGLNQRMVTARCTVKAGTTTEVTLDARGLEQQGVALAVRVLLGDQPLAEGMLEAAPQDGEGRVALAMVRDGAARLAGLAPGSLRLQVRTGMTMAPVGDPQTVTVDERPEQTVTVALPGGRLAGRVIEDASGKPLPHATVKLQSRRSAQELADFGFAVAGADG